MISLETPQRKLAHLAWKGEPPGFSRVAAGALELTMGTSVTRCGGLRKRQPRGSSLGASRDSSPVDAGAKDLVCSRCRNLRIPLQCDMDLGVLLESPQGSQSSSQVGACTCAFLPSRSSSVTVPFAWIKGSVAFPRGFPTRLSHEAFPQRVPCATVV